MSRASGCWTWMNAAPLSVFCDTRLYHNICTQEFISLRFHPQFTLHYSYSVLAKLLLYSHLFIAVVEIITVHSTSARLCLSFRCSSSAPLTPMTRITFILFFTSLCLAQVLLGCSPCHTNNVAEQRLAERVTDLRLIAVERFAPSELKLTANSLWDNVLVAHDGTDTTFGKLQCSFNESQAV